MEIMAGHLINRVVFFSIALLFFSGFCEAANNAQFISQSVPSSMIAGQTYQVSVTMKNTGTTTWTEAAKYRLGSQNPQDNHIWNGGRAGLSGNESIPPGASKTFTFSVTAPANPGTYNFQWRMVQELVEWFGDYSTNTAVRVTTTYLQVLSSGQSLSVGAEASPVLSATQPYNNVMLSPNVQGTAGPFIPLIESGVETPSAGIANSLHAYDTQGRPVVVGLHGVGGYAYYQLKKGTTPYANGMLQASTIKSLVEAGGNTYKPVAVTIVHGESDYWNGNSSQYEGFLEEWQSDYQKDVNALTGSTSVLPMFIDQMNTAATGELAVAQLNAHRDNPVKIILVEPKYQYTYVPTAHIHVNNVASKHMGEMFAKAIKKVVLDAQTWDPLMPTQVIRNGNIITISYAIPVGTLAIDTTQVAARPNYGFEFAQTGGTATTITSVALVNGNTQVQLTLNRVPDGTNQHVRYAWRCYAGNMICGDPANGAWVGGNIRDTDTSVSPAVGSTGLPLYDWGVTFDEPVVQNVDPIGAYDYAGCDYISGWSCDQNDYSMPLYVHFYAGGPAGGGGAFVGYTAANITREQAVGNLCGGYRAHGFQFATPSSLKNGSLQNIYVYSINTPQGNNPLLGNKTFRCTSTTTTTSTRTTTTTTTTTSTTTTRTTTTTSTTRTTTTTSTTTTTLRVPGDANGDGRVNYADLVILAASYGKSTGENGFDPRADFDSDGIVGYGDLVILAAYYGA